MEDSLKFGITRRLCYTGIESICDGDECLFIDANILLNTFKRQQAHLKRLDTKILLHNYSSGRRKSFIRNAPFLAITNTLDAYGIFTVHPLHKLHHIFPKDEQSVRLSTCHQRVYCLVHDVSIPNVTSLGHKIGISLGVGIMSGRFPEGASRIP